jgi:TRAP-type transport system small permease protein
MTNVHEKFSDKNNDDPAIFRAMDKINTVVIAFAKIIQFILFSTMIIVVAYEVVMRYIFLNPTMWSEALARYCMIWLVLFGMALSIFYREHIRVDYFVFNFSPTIQKILGYIRLLIVLVISLVLIRAGYIMAVSNITQIAPGLHIPVFWKYISVPVTSTLALYFVVQKIIRRDTDPF